MQPLALAQEPPPTADLLERIPDPALNALVTVKQAAQFLQMTEGLVIDLINWGTLPCVRSGDERFIRFADVVAHKRELDERDARAAPYTRFSNEFIPELAKQGLI